MHQFPDPLSPIPYPRSLIPYPRSLIPYPYHKGFTLVELLVVIAIIGILSGIMLATMGSGTESARAAQCLSNMKNLANACQARAMATRHYPLAGSIQYLLIDESQGIQNAKKTYQEEKGWISWMSEGHFPATSKTTPGSIGFMSRDTKENLFALTNGALWQYVSKTRSVYTCPSHVHSRGTKSKPLWSYAMNAYFKWNATDGYAFFNAGNGRLYGTEKRSDRVLLFAEIPFRGVGDSFPTGEGSGMEDDAILQFDGCNKVDGLGRTPRNGNEYIGANHPAGNARNAKEWFAHVVFTDGHTEKIRVTNLDVTGLRKLTTYLCTGVDYAIDGSTVNELN